MTEDELSNLVIGCAIKIHRALGPGLLESAYRECLLYELTEAGVFAEKEKPMPLIYGKVQLDCGYRLDLLVEYKLVVEIKAVEEFHPVHMAQILTYLRLSRCKLGLLINFHVPLLKDGIKRVIL